ncbi:MAG: chemotaxis protein CheC [Candidatus Omnitrophota bacterium]
MAEIKFDSLERDALKEIGSICSGNAATALSQLFNKTIKMDVPEILFIPVENVPEAIGGAEKLVVGLVTRVLGDFPSIILLVFSPKDAKSLASLMTEKRKNNGGVISDMERSALKEIGVILSNAYLGALSLFLQCGLVPRVPELIEDMAGAMLDYILIDLSNVSEYALLIKSDFKEESTHLTGNFFLIPNAEGLEILLNVIRKS